MQMRTEHGYGTQWSPCSNFLSFILNDAGTASLLVLNSSLEMLYAWHHDGPWLSSVRSVWAANSTLLGAAQLPGPLQHHQLGACWNPRGQQPALCSEAAQVTELLAGIDAGAIVQHLSWGPCKAVAAIVKPPPQYDYWVSNDNLHVFGGSVHGSGRICDLYVLEAGQSMTSMSVMWNPALSSGNEVIWSPAGDRLLLNSSYSLQLVTTRCNGVVNVGDELEYQLRLAVFSSDAKFFASACQGVVTVHDATNGDIIHSVGVDVLQERGQKHWDLSFDDNANQLILIGWKDVRIISFGWGSDSLHTSSRELCNGIAAISSHNIAR